MKKVDMCDRHAVQFYEDEAFLTSAVVEFLAGGIEHGAPCVIIATPAHADAIQRRLGPVATRGLVVCDAATMLGAIMEGDSPDRARFLSRASALVLDGTPGAPVRVFGEMVDLLCRDGRRRAAIELEELWNELGERYTFCLLCAYSMGCFRAQNAAPDFDRICQAHARVTPTEEFDREAAVEARYREIAQLQQRARALEHEIEQRARAEAELRDREDRLRRQNVQLEGALRAKDEFLAVVGHELRNPLASILSALELLRARGAQAREHAVIERQCFHLVHLVDNLLDVSRLVRGEIELQRRRIDIASLIERGVELAGPVIESRRDDLEFRVPPGVDVHVDVDRMAQVMENLLLNAAKFSEPGSAIVVWAEARGSTVLLGVRDHGSGIDPDLADNVFDLFVQQPQPLDRAGGGLGVGLAIVQNIVALHGGSVALRSEGPARGTEFLVTLPAAIPSVRAPAGGRAGEDAPASPLRLLIVDDNEDAAMLLAELLKAHRHEVAVAYDGASALEIAGTFRPDVALVDIGLPVVDGYELALRLRALGRPLRVIAVSGYGDETSRARIARSAFDAHLIKPVQFDELLKAACA